MLNANYYNKRIDEHSISQGGNKVVYLTTSVILNNYRGKNVYFNFPKRYDLKEIINLLYENLSNQIFANHADITDYSVGDKLKRNGEKWKNIYVIKEIRGTDYILTKDKDDSNLKITSTFDKLKRNYIQIKQSTRNSTLSKFNDFFKDINEYGFLPTHFSKKIVLIAGQTMWNNLKKKDCIPTIYLPNTRESEQTIRKSIEALSDCIAYVTPKYDVCYDEILRRNIAIDTIIVCDTDVDKIEQIISDKSQYIFNLIVLSSENTPKSNANLKLWNWHKEEINLLEEKASNKIDINGIQDNELNSLIQHFEDCIKYVSEFEVPIKLNSYGYFLRLALNAIQEEQLDYLLMRLKSNKELERNEGGYEDFADKNPKEALKNIILYLKKYNLKQVKLKQIINNSTKNSLIVADREDTNFLKEIRSNKCEIVTNAELKILLKNGETNNKTIVFYSFNGSKDFDYIYNLPNDVLLVLYKQEEDLYLSQFQAYRKRLEIELTGEDRFLLCSIKYEPIVELEIKVNPTLEQIIERLEQRSNTAYNGYKDESDSLLDDLEDEITYQISFNDNSAVELERNETVFDNKGSLIKSRGLKVGDKVRIYPKEQLAENLFQVAVDVEPDKFGLIDKHSDLWREILKMSENRYPNRETLYKELEKYGLRVLPATVDSYFNGKRKFPMYDSDLKAICALADEIIPDKKISQTIFPILKKYKRLYNSTMITLGRNLKQELQQFLKDKTVGEILQKKNFTAEALQRFIDEYMPLLTIVKIEEVSDEQ